MHHRVFPIPNRIFRSANCCVSRGCRCGFSITEMLIVLAILGGLLMILLPVLAKVRDSSRTIQCINNLRGLSGALQASALDNQGRMPDPATANRSWEQMIFRYYRGSFECPADGELYPAVGSSYDWRDTGLNETTMAGKSLADVRRPEAVFVLESLPGWHAMGRINIARIDGSAATIAAEECFKDLTKPIRAGN